jgi:hypothetical protein
MFKSTFVLSLVLSAGVVLSDKCVVVNPTSGYPVPDPSSTSSSAQTPYPTQPTAPLTRESCIQIASQLQFVKGGELSSGSDGVNLDVGQAGQAQHSNNPFARYLRKESAGFSLPFTSVPGTAIKTFNPLTPGMVVHTDDYQINFIYSQVGSKITDVKCHYKDEDINGGDEPTSSYSTSNPSSTPAPSSTLAPSSTSAPSYTSAPSSTPTPSPKPPLNRDSCIQVASQLQFVKGGELSSGNDGVNLDVGQAGQAQHSNNPFARYLRKESAGFSLPFTSVPGIPIKTFSPLTPGMVVSTDDYQINFIYSQVGRKIIDIKCHYKDEDISEGYSSATYPTTITYATAPTSGPSSSQ